MSENAEAVVVEDVELDEEIEDTPEATKQEKPKKTPAEELKALEGRAARLRKDLGIETPKPTEKKAEAVENKGFGDAQLALLEVKGVTHEEDIQWLEKLHIDSGKTLRELFSTEWVKKDLKERQEGREESKKTQDATPSGSKRSGASRNDVDFYLQKYLASGSLADIPKEMQGKVLNARIAKEKSSSSIFGN